MKWKSPSLWMAIVSAVAVGGIVVADLSKRRSPGPLAEVHNREEDLSGRWDCSTCHGGWRETMTESCKKCHEDVATQIDSGLGLHGTFEREKADSCAQCHSDHHGADFAMVNENSFAAAGVPDVLKFDHMVINYSMEGKHLELECVKCHKEEKTVVLEKGSRRYLGLEQDCATCHEDPHKGRMKLACADCHGQDDFLKIFSKDHDRFLPLIGGHADLTCRTCHAEKSKRPLEQTGRTLNVVGRECSECHETPHAKSFVAGVAEIAATTPGKSCVGCHKADHLVFAEPTIEVTKEQHAKTGFQLTKPHHKQECSACHMTTGTAFKTRYPGRTQNACERCHTDPHEGQFRKGPFASGGCIGCHSAIEFTPHVFTVVKHEKAALPLLDEHASTKCEECHKVPAKGRARVFRGTTSECGRCHQDGHDGFFAKFEAKRKPVKHGSCARCHDAASFSNLPADGFEHDAWTGFALNGAHAENACEQCHVRTKKPDKSGRTFGRVAAVFGKLRGCVTCHKDPHWGLFDRESVPEEVDGLRDCARCHDEVSFRNFAGPFEHGAWTGWPLDGAHALLDCTDCHPTLPEADKLGRTFARAEGQDCADCHQDPHDEQFAVEGGIDCRRCHRSAKRFSDLFFNHNLQSRFRLDETHAAVPCLECHKPYRKGRRDIVRYRPLGMDCGDCHGAPKDLLNRRKGKKE